MIIIHHHMDFACLFASDHVILNIYFLHYYYYYYCRRIYLIINGMGLKSIVHCRPLIILRKWI